MTTLSFPTIARANPKMQPRRPARASSADPDGRRGRKRARPAAAAASAGIGAVEHAFHLWTQGVMRAAAAEGNELDAVATARQLGRAARVCRASMAAVCGARAAGLARRDPAWCRVEVAIDVWRHLPEPLWQHMVRQHPQKLLMKMIVSGSFVARHFWPGRAAYTQPGDIDLMVCVRKFIVIPLQFEEALGGIFRTTSDLVSQYVRRKAYSKEPLLQYTDNRHAETTGGGYSFISGRDMTALLNDAPDGVSPEAAVRPQFTMKCAEQPYPIQITGVSILKPFPSLWMRMTNHFDMNHVRVFFDGRRVVTPDHLERRVWASDADFYCRHCRAPRIMLSPIQWAPGKRQLSNIKSYIVNGGYENRSSRLTGAAVRVAIIHLLRRINRYMDRGFVTCSPGRHRCVPCDAIDPVSRRYDLMPWVRLVPGRGAPL